MKYLVLLSAVSLGCLVYFVSTIDMSGLHWANGDPIQDSIDSTLTSASPSSDGALDSFGTQSETWDATSQNAPKLVLMKFGAPWCPPCRMVDKELGKLARTSLPVDIEKIDVDEKPRMAQEYDVSSIPRLILLQDGRVIGDVVGYKSASELADWIQESASEQALAGKKRSSRPSVVHANPFFN